MKKKHVENRSRAMKSEHKAIKSVDWILFLGVNSITWARRSISRLIKSQNFPEIDLPLSYLTLENTFNFLYFKITNYIFTRIYETGNKIKCL